VHFLLARLDALLMNLPRVGCIFVTLPAMTLHSRVTTRVL
jgi:hypothetical protein